MGHRCSSDLLLLWLWHTTAVVAPIGTLTLEPLYATSAAMKTHTHTHKNHNIKIVNTHTHRYIRFILVLELYVYIWIIFLKYIICIFVPVCVMIFLPVYNMGGSVWRVIGWIKEIFSPFRKNALQQKQPNKKHCLLSHAFFSLRITRFLLAKSMTILYSNILYK